MDFEQNSTNGKIIEEKKNNHGILVPLIYNLIFYNTNIVAFYIGLPILLETRNNQFIKWMKRNGGFKKEFITDNFNNDDDDEIL